MRKKFIITIPKNILIVYSKTKKILTFLGPEKIKTLKLYLKLNLLRRRNAVEVTQVPFALMSNQNIRQIKSMQGTIVALIKQIIAEVSVFMFKKLKLVGVGYKAIPLAGYNRKVILFKLGFSHFLYFNLPPDYRTKIFKFTKMFICGNSYQGVAQLAAIIRGYKEPDPYKGKGILYFSEQIILKEGKRA
jgi:large subunit ribosomal protein L6